MLRHLFILLVAVLLGAGCTQSAKLNRHLKRADAAWEKGDLETARLEYLNAIKLAPNQPEVVSRLGFIFFDRGEIVPAAQLLARAKEMQPTNVAVRLKLGAIFAAVGRFTNAVEEAEYVLTQTPANGEAAVLLANSTPRTQLAALEQRIHTLAGLNPNSADIQLAQGIIQNRTGNEKGAEESFKKAHSLDPKNSKPALALGNMYWFQNRTNEAATLLKAASDAAKVRSIERLRFAEFQLRHGQPEQGRTLLEDTVSKAPDFLLARTALAEIYLMERRTNDCSAQIAAVLKSDARNASALLVRSRLKQALGDADGAIEDLETITRDNTTHQVAFYELARLYRSRNDFSRALASVDRALSVRTNFMQGVLLKSELLAANGDYAAAIPPLISLTNQAPKNPAPYFLLASALRARGTPEDALAVYRQMSQIFPNDPQPYQNAAVTYRQQKRYAEARQAYNRALQIQTNFLPAIDDLIELDIIATNYTAALDRVQGYIDLYPDKPMPRVLQAKVYVAEKKWAEAEASLKKAIETSPEFYLAHRSLATLYITSQQTAQAIEKLKALVETNPKDVGSMLQLGMMYEASTNYTSARDIYGKLIAVQPNATYALNNLAYLLSEHFHDNDKAWVLAQKARAQNPNDPFLADTFGWIAFRRGDYVRALPVLQYAVDRLPDKPEVNYHLGMAYYMSGQKAQAEAALAGALDSKEEFIGKDQARVALSVLRVDPKAPQPGDKKLIGDLLAQNPNDVFALIRLAQIQQQEKEWPKAAATYEAALKASPKSPAILLQLASLKTEHLNQKQEGLAHAREAWALAQDQQTAATVGRIGVLAGDPRWALPILQMANRASGEDPRLAFYLAVASYAQADLKSVVETLGRAVNSSSNFPEKALAERFLTLAKFHRGTAPASSIEEAVTFLLKTDPGFAPGLVGSGMILESHEKFPEARQQYEMVLKVTPDHLLAQRQLAVLLADKLQDDNGAASIATKLRPQLPEDPLVSQVLGKIAYRRGDYRGAAPLLSSAAARMPRNADTLYYLGLSEFHLKQKNARHSLTEALSLDPGAKLAADARKALSELN